MKKRASSIAMQRAEIAAGYALVCGPDFQLPEWRAERPLWQRGLVIAAGVIITGVIAASLFVA
ncbi:MAG: hypothetical protein J0I16_09750 [Rhizobiales bacterium]|nr:hypothetical protein [Hyphomicrobiales bacterium]